VQFHKDEILQPGRSIKFFMNAKFGCEPPADKAPTGYYKRPAGYGAPMFYKAPIMIAWSWAGPYLGLNISYSAGKSKTDALFSDTALGTPLFATDSTENLNGLIGGAQAGYNWQQSIGSPASGPTSRCRRKAQHRLMCVPARSAIRPSPTSMRR
jgi:iron complex outermembrane receptor protein